MIIRKAELKDISGIAKVHVDSWRTTYKGIVPDSFLDNLSYENREQIWKRGIEENHIYIAEDDERPNCRICDRRKRTNRKV